MKPQNLKSIGFARSATNCFIVFLGISALLFSPAFAQSLSGKFQAVLSAGVSPPQQGANLGNAPRGPMAVAAWKQKLDPAARMLMASYGDVNKLSRASGKFSKLGPISVERNAAGRLMVDLFIELHSPGDAARLDFLGIERRAQVGNIVAGRAPLEALRLLADEPAVRFVEVSKKRRALLNAGRAEIGADAVHQGAGLPRAYQGEGVIVGVIDSGIDFTHPDFRDANGSRIQNLLEFTQGGGQNEWAKIDIDNNPGGVTQRDGNGAHGHGTHVTGIAAGGGQINSVMRGIAPRADIIFVKGIRDPDSDGGFSDTDVIDGCQFIFQQAQTQGKPAVINLSLGGHSGPHDGSSLYEQALSDLTGPGKIIVAAAGNEGFDVIHAGGNSVPTVTNETLLFAEPSQQFAVVDMWYDPGTITLVSIAAYTVDQNQDLVFLGNTPPLSVGQSIDFTPFVISGDTLGYVAIDAETVQDQRNGDGQVLFAISDNDNPNVDISQVIWSVASAGPSAGRLDMWMATGGEFNSSIVGIPNETEMPGDTDFTIGTPATAQKVIAVGSYVTKNTWNDVDGNQQQQLNPNPSGQGNPVVPVLGQRSYFSSKGPTRDGRIAPDIAAPGEIIFSALSASFTNVERPRTLQGGGYHGQQGTSQATPHVTGVVALMLQANPNLTYENVLQILQETARADQQTGGVPNNLFGAGRIDALAAVQRVAGSSGATTLRSFDPQDTQRVFVIERVQPIDSGFVFGTNRYEDRAKATAFSLPGGATQTTVTEVKVWFGYKRSGLTNQTYRLEIYNGNPTSGPQGAAIFSQTYTLANILADNNLQTPEQPTVHTLPQAVTVGSAFFVAVNFGAYSQADWGSAAIVSTNLLGQRVAEEWELWEDGSWHNVSDAWNGQNSTPGSGTDGWRMWIEATVSLGTAVEEPEAGVVPKTSALYQNYPNPFNPQTEIKFDLAQHGRVLLRVYNLVGQEVARLLDGSLPPGAHHVIFDAAQLPSGIYFYRLQVGGFEATKRMLVIK